MEKAAKIIRRSIHTLLKDFHYFTSIPAILLLPFSSSILLSLSFYQPCSLTRSIFQGKRVSLLVLDLPQMIFVLVFSLPLALSSLVLAKASIIQSLNHHKHVFSLSCSSPVSLCYKPLVLTCICNIILTVTITTTTLSFLFEASSFFKSLLILSSIRPFFDLAAGIVFYMVLTNTMVTCNLALVVAGIDNCTIYKSLRKACLLRKGTDSMALLLALPINLGLVATEALFRYRIVRAYDPVFGRFSMPMILEGLLIAYLFSLLVVLDTISSYLFIRNCDPKIGREGAEICVQIEPVKDDSGISDGSQGLEMVFVDWVFMDQQSYTLNCTWAGILRKLVHYLHHVFLPIHQGKKKSLSVIISINGTPVFSISINWVQFTRKSKKMLLNEGEDGGSEW